MTRLALLGALLVAMPAYGEEDSARELVEGFCAACHSFALVRQQRLSREVWDEVLTWMVEEQGMPELDAPDRARVLEYLSRVYGIDRPR